MNMIMPIKRKRFQKPSFEKTKTSLELTLPLKKRRRINNEEPLKYFLEDFCANFNHMNISQPLFPVEAYVAGKPNIDEESYRFNNVMQLHSIGIC